jgi:5-methyltetrahydrofolate--homocysteine methyltransferase
VASQLLSAESKDEYIQGIRKEYVVLRDRHKHKKSEVEMISLAEARANKYPIEWADETVTRPSFLGVRTFVDYPLAELVDTIDWTPFFSTWELSGSYPDILEDDVVGESAKSLFTDAQYLLKTMIADKWVKANAVIGFFPANSVGDDIEVYVDERRTQLLTTFHMLRQQTRKMKGKYNMCLADFVAPKSSGIGDYIGLFAVTAGLDINTQLAVFENNHDDYNAIMLKALADRLAESFAEHMHARVRREFWSYAAHETLSNEELIAEKYRGIRPAPGYPACPDHTEKPAIFSLLKAEENAQIILTENYAMLPAAAVSGYYFSHPQSQYFGIGKIASDQVADYAKRKKMDEDIIRRWLATHLMEEKEMA